MDLEAREVNHVFFTYILKSRPHVTLKVAQTINSKVAREDRSSPVDHLFRSEKGCSS